jgi:MarR family transcriptional regulator, transcriptional regulator for hemolysin
LFCSDIAEPPLKIDIEQFDFYHSPVPRPRVEPIGRQVARTAKVLSRAFDEELARAGGSLPTWLILLSLKSRSWRTQRDLAEALGIRGPTLTHHLAGLERAGLVRRTRDPDNRRVQRVELTEAGDAAFDRLRRAASSFDTRLRTGLDEGEIQQLRELLARLLANATRDEPNAAQGSSARTAAS